MGIGRTQHMTSTMSFLCCTNHPAIPPSLPSSSSSSHPRFSITIPPRLKSSTAWPILLASCSAATFSAGKQPLTILRVAAASAVLFFGLGGLGSAPAFSASPHPSRCVHEEEKDTHRVAREDGGNDGQGEFEDEEINAANAAFEAWKRKTYPLSVPLRIVALRGSIPPSWEKDFVLSQGKRSRVQAKFVGSLESIFSDLSVSFDKPNVAPTSTVAADIVSIGDSWLSFAIKKALIEPIRAAEDQDWFQALSDKWKVYLRRNYEGEIDPEGKIWAAPYRFGSMVIAYKKSKFQKHKLAPVQDWADLWQPELAGRISMVASPREVVGAVLKYMGASYNTKNIDLQVAGGRNAIQRNLALLGKQVRLFDSTHYLKALGVGDVWVAVGWSSDVLPFAKRMSDVAVVVPKSGSSLWADLWAIPAASRLETSQIGGRVRGPSPLIHQWMEFCLQVARALPFKQEVIPGATPSALESTPVEVPKELTKGSPRLDGNLIAGVPCPEILSRCEFLEPLSEATLSDYNWLIDSIQNPNLGDNHIIQNFVSSVIRTFRPKKH